MKIKLGVNIDHVATLREARGASDPDLAQAAAACRQAGADVIIAHLRQDRRPMQEADVFKLCALRGATHLEISADPEIVAIARRARPGSVCLVPESSSELTTQGGWDLKASAKAVGRAIERLKTAGIEVSLLVEPEAANVRLAKFLGADLVELGASAYARAKGKGRAAEELERLELAGYLADEMGLGLHVGHSLDYHNVRPVARMAHLKAVHIGFSIIARALFVGLKPAVAEMKRLVA